MELGHQYVVYKDILEIVGMRPIDKGDTFIDTMGAVQLAKNNTHYENVIRIVVRFKETEENPPDGFYLVCADSFPCEEFIKPQDDLTMHWNGFRWLFSSNDETFYPDTTYAVKNGCMLEPRPRMQMTMSEVCAMAGGYVEIIDG